MARDTNLVSISGRLGRDPEPKALGGDKSLVILRIATTRNFRQGDEWQEETSWFDVVVWDPFASWVTANLKKGAAIAITGRLQQKTWETEDGKKQSKVEIVADSVAIPVDTRNADAPRSTNRPSGGAKSSYGNRPARQTAAVQEDDEVPF